MKVFRPGFSNIFSVFFFLNGINCTQKVKVLVFFLSAVMILPLNAFFVKTAQVYSRPIVWLFFCLAYFAPTPLDSHSNGEDAYPEGTLDSMPPTYFSFIRPLLIALMLHRNQYRKEEMEERNQYLL